MFNKFSSPIQKFALVLILAFFAIASRVVSAQDAGKMIRIPSARQGVEIPIYVRRTPDASATVVLLSGGAGGIGKLNDTGWPGSSNFLIRTAPLFASSGFNVIAMAKPSDIDSLEYAFRISKEHVDDIKLVLQYAKEKFGMPAWLVGTSRGTISATAAGIALRDDNLIGGLVLTSSVTSYKKIGAVPSQNLDRINVPVLVMHHEKDTCFICQPYEVNGIIKGLKNAPIKKLVMVNNGSGATGDPCEALHYHGYIGMEAEAVEIIANWIKNPSN